MQISQIIKKTGAALLLAVFMLAVMPKRSIHDWVVKHKDSSCKTVSDGSQQITKSIFSCACDNLVAESPFESATGFNIYLFTTYSPALNHSVTKQYFAPSIFTSLRGPPLEFQT